MVINLFSDLIIYFDLNMKARKGKQKVSVVHACMNV